jgi:hypothetical protein
MEVSSADDLPPIREGTFYIVKEDGQKMILHSDERTSVGWALRQAIDNPDWATSEAAPCNYNLYRGLHELLRLSVKIMTVSDGYAEDQRVLSWKRKKKENSAVMKRTRRAQSAPLKAFMIPKQSHD